MPDPIQISSKLWPEVGLIILANWLASRLDLFGQNLTDRTKLDLGWFCTIWSGHLWMIATKSESGKLVADQLHPARNWAQWFLHTGFLPDQMCFTKPWQDRPDWILVGFVQTELNRKKQNWIGCGKSDLVYTIHPNSGCTLAITAMTGHNQTLLDRIRHVYWEDSVTDQSGDDDVVLNVLRCRADIIIRDSTRPGCSQYIYIHNVLTNKWPTMTQPVCIVT